MRKLSIFVVVLALGAFASAATLTGTVKNQTTGKPVAGDQVALLALSQGMNEISHTKTDASGNFKFDLENATAPHLVRVTHDGVNYFPASGPISPGTTTTEVLVYDGAKNVDGISTTVNVMRVQADAGNLQVLELIAVKNDSKPPRALSSDRTYEFYLPNGAQVDQMMAQAPGGMPVNVSPNPEGKTGKYAVSYALKPGETRFEVAYHLPYSGEATFAPKVSGNVQHFVVMMPKSMTFEAKDNARFSPMNEDTTATIQVATNVTPTTDLSFRVSGSGLLPDEQQQAQQGGSAGGTTTADNRPGGGLGAPIDAPDPLHEHRWMILGGLAVVLISGGVFVVSRANQQASAGGLAPAKPVKPFATATSLPNATSAQPVSTNATAKDRSSVLLDALKEELFQLEIERQQGKISSEEYQKSRAALDQTLRRALLRQNS
jgi:hypothetical protein